MINSAVASTMAERLEELGCIGLDRVRLDPAPGTATIDDLVAANSNGARRCELIDHTLVEKVMGYEASVVAAVIARILGNFVASRKLGLVSGADGFFQLLTSSVRGPDVALVLRDRLPNGRFPTDAFPSIAPDLVVEVLSPGNTKQEMSRKRIEYFHSGVQLVWMVDCTHRTVAVYQSPDRPVILNENDTITAEPVLADFSHPVAEFFADLDLGAE